MTEGWRQKLYREIPNVDDVLESPEVRKALEGHPRWAVLEAIRGVLEERRVAISAMKDAGEGDEDGSFPQQRFLSRLAILSRPHLGPLINGTGIIVHTNFGRSLLPDAAIRQAQAAASGYTNLEYDVASGRRGSRQDHVTKLLCRLTGAEGALAVNNNAAAVMLCLGTLAAGKEVIVSRGQLVEIGGSFRIPDVMAKSGALLREVGTTNKTHPADYKNAVGPETALLLKVHTSNFQVVGFTSDVGLEELSSIGREFSLPVMEDLGSGSLVDLAPYGLTGEPTVPAVVRAGADLVTFSGDKLLGGPQAGLIVGRKDLIAKIHRNPVHRAVRLDKVTLASLEATLRIYLEGDRALEQIPTLRMISRPVAEVRGRARRLFRRLDGKIRRLLDAAVVSSTAQVGGGALPLQELPSAALAVGSAHRPAHQLEAALRGLPVPVIGRIHEGRLLLDMRTVDDGDIRLVAEALSTVAGA